MLVPFISVPLPQTAHCTTKPVLSYSWNSISSSNRSSCTTVSPPVSAISDAKNTAPLTVISAHALAVCNNKSSAWVLSGCISPQQVHKSLMLGAWVLNAGYMRPRRVHEFLTLGAALFIHSLYCLPPSSRYLLSAAAANYLQPFIFLSTCIAWLYYGEQFTP